MKISSDLYNYLKSGQEELQNIATNESLKEYLKQREFVTAGGVIGHLLSETRWEMRKETVSSSEEASAILLKLKTNRDKYLSEIESISVRNYQKKYGREKKKSLISRILSSIISLDHDRNDGNEGNYKDYRNKKDNKTNENIQYIEIQNDSVEWNSLENKWIGIKYDVVLNLYGLDVSTKENEDIVKNYIRRYFPESKVPKNNYDHHLPNMFKTNFKDCFEGYFLLKELQAKRPDLVDKNLLKVISDTLFERYTEIINVIEKNTFKYNSGRYFELLELFDIKFATSVKKVLSKELKRYTDFIEKNNECLLVSKNGLKVSDYKAVNLAMGLDIDSVERFFINLQFSILKEGSAPAKNVRGFFKEISLRNDLIGLDFELKDESKMKVLEELKNVIKIVLNDHDFSSMMRISFMSKGETKEKKIEEAITEKANFLTEGLLIIMDDIIKRNGELKEINNRIYKQEITQLILETGEKSNDMLTEKSNNLKK